MLFYTFYQGGEIKGNGEKWYFYGSDGGRYDISDINVKDIYFFNDITMGSEYMRYAGGKNIRLHFLKYGFYQTTFIPSLSTPSSGTVLKQYMAWKNNEKRLVVARQIVKAEIASALRVWKSSYHVKDLLYDIEYATDVESIRGIEAKAMKRFWQLYKEKYSDFQGRVFNPPPDKYNALISFAYAHLYGSSFSAIKLVGLDPRIGYLHENRFRTYTLHLDVADMYKPLIVQFVFSLFSRKAVKRNWFQKLGLGVFLSEEGRKSFLEYWDDFLRDRGGHWCGKYSFLIMLVRDMRDLRGFLVAGERMFRTCIIEEVGI